MDTRSKIVSGRAAVAAHVAAHVAAAVTAEASRRDGPLTLVTGYFDPMLAWHARELQRIGSALTSAGKLAVAVLPLEGELLPQPARAALVAALRVVDYVFTAENGDLDGLFAELKPAQIVRLEEPDLRRRLELIHHVRSRQIR